MNDGYRPSSNQVPLNVNKPWKKVLRWTEPKGDCFLPSKIFCPACQHNFFSFAMFLCLWRLLSVITTIYHIISLSYIFKGGICCVIWNRKSCAQMKTGSHGVEEAIAIGKIRLTLNQNDGRHHLENVWQTDMILVTYWHFPAKGQKAPKTQKHHRTAKMLCWQAGWNIFESRWSQKCVLVLCY